MALSYKRMEHNTNISYMGKMRQRFLCPDDIAAMKPCPVPWRSCSSSPNFYITNPAQIKGIQVVRLDTSAQLEEASSVNIGDIMSCPSKHLRKQTAETEVIPYFFTRALNLGQPPPRRQRTQLVLFTDPWRKEIFENRNF